MRKLITKTEIMDASGWSSATFERRIRKSGFPAAVSDGGGVRRWWSDEINAYLENFPSWESARKEAAHA